MTAIGQLYRRMRLFMGLDQKDVARQIGVRRPTVSDWELGRYRIQDQHRARMDALLRVPPEMSRDLMRYEELPEPVITELVLMIARAEDGTVASAMRRLGYDA